MSSFYFDINKVIHYLINQWGLKNTYFYKLLIHYEISQPEKGFKEKYMKCLLKHNLKSSLKFKI